MPKTKAEKAAYHKQYYLANKEKLLAKVKQYSLDNKEKISVQKKQYRLTNKEKIKQYKLDNHRRETIRKWITQSKLIHDDYDALYDEYLLATNCNICDVLLTTGKICKTLKVMDHCHSTGLFRQFLCNYCNWNFERFKKI